MLSVNGLKKSLGGDIVIIRYRHPIINNRSTP